MIPSSPISALSLGPLTIHFYALCILAGIGVAMWWATKRWEKRGGDGDTLFDIVFAAVVAGIVGSRIWHVLTSPELFFGPEGDPLAVLYIWQGGLAIYGGVAGGAIAVWIMARIKGVSFTALADTIGPTLMIAQALGRTGNWFNQELYGPPLDTWWAWDVTCVTNGQTIGGCVPGTYHPTFLYEQLWLLAGLAVLLLLSRRFQWAGGRVFWAYVAIYSTGRALDRCDPQRAGADDRVDAHPYPGRPRHGARRRPGVRSAHDPQAAARERSSLPTAPSSLLRRPRATGPTRTRPRSPARLLPLPRILSPGP